MSMLRIKGWVVLMTPNRSLIGSEDFDLGSIFERFGDLPKGLGVLVDGPGDVLR